MVERDDGRTLAGAGDPLAGHARRPARRSRLSLAWRSRAAAGDRPWFAWFWRHLRGLGQMFDTVVCANGELARRLVAGGVANVETIRMGVERGLFAPSLRSRGVAARQPSRGGLDAAALLLLGIGRLSAEKRWQMVLRAVGDCGRSAPVGLLLIGDGSRRRSLQMFAGRLSQRRAPPAHHATGPSWQHCWPVPMHWSTAASRDLLPGRGRGARERRSDHRPRSRCRFDQLVDGRGNDATRGPGTIARTSHRPFIDRGPELQRAAAIRSSRSARWTSISATSSLATNCTHRRVAREVAGPVAPA